MLQSVLVVCFHQFANLRNPRAAHMGTIDTLSLISPNRYDAMCQLIRWQDPFQCEMYQPIIFTPPEEELT